jgi:hypothetical protein
MTLASTTLPTWKLVAYISLVEVEAGLTALAHSAVHKANRVDGGKKGRSDLYTYIHIHTFKYIYIHIHIIHTYTYIYIYIYVYIHTYIYMTCISELRCTPLKCTCFGLSGLLPVPGCCGSWCGVCLALSIVAVPGSPYLDLDFSWDFSVGFPSLWPPSGQFTISRSSRSLRHPEHLILQAPSLGIAQP